MVTFDRTFRAASAKQIAGFEKVHSVLLPDDYKEFLCTTNGGTPTPNCFNVPDRGDAICAILYGIRDKREPADLQWEQEQASEWDPLPPGFVVIGHDPGGNSLILATCGKQAGKILFWDRNGLWIREDGHNTFPVSNGFRTFLEGLQERPAEPKVNVKRKQSAKGRRTNR